MESPPSNWTATAAATAVLACALAALVVGAKSRRAAQALPTPPSTLPILGNTLDLMKFQLPRLHDWITEQCLLHGGRSWLLQALGAPPLVVLCSVETFEDVLKTQFEIFDKGERMSTIFHDVIGEGIVAVDGDKWRFQRKRLTHLFTMRAFRETITASVHKYVRVFGDVLERVAAQPETPLDFGEACHRLAFDVFAEVGFGLQKNTLATGGDAPFLAAFAVAAEALEARFHQPDFLWQLKRLLRVGDERRLADAVEVLNSEIYAIIYDCLRRRNDPRAAGGGQDVVSLFLEADGGDADDDKAHEPKVDSKLLRDVGITILAAGKDTTALTLSWLTIELNRHPRVAARIRDELRASLPQLFADRAFVPALEDVEPLVYLEAALRESLRLHPVVPLNAKEANRDTTLSDGTFIARGTRAYIPSYALARMPSVWGPDAAEFRPERWLETDAASGKLRLVHVPATKFVSFHAGPRVCLGMRFALFELKATLAYVLSKFELTTVKKPEDFTYTIASALAIKGPVLVTVSRVAASA